MVKFPIICIEEEGCEWLLSKEKNQSVNHTKHNIVISLQEQKTKEPQNSISEALYRQKKSRALGKSPHKVS